MEPREFISDQYSENISLSDSKCYLSENDKSANCNNSNSSESDDKSDEYLSDSSYVSDAYSTATSDEAFDKILNYQDKLNNIFKKIDKSDTDIDKQILNFIEDINWKQTAEETDITEYENMYDQICKQVTNIPKILDVLKLPMPYDEKCDLFEKILLLNNLSPITSEFFDLKKYINKIIKNYKVFSISNIEYKKYKDIEMSLNCMDEKIKPVEYQILDLDISDYNKAFIYSRYKYLLESEASSLHSSNKLKKWIESIINIPTKIKPMLVNASDSGYEKNKYLWTVKNLLDKEVYGLTDVKEKILFLLNNRITNQNSKGLNFALSGPPGVAKTSIINVLSKSINLPFFQINAAGMKDSSFLLGHNYTYEGSSPGVIVQGLSAMKYKNGIIYFDEFDKISSTEHGIEISRTLLHITDFSQNSKFHDRYISEQIDIDLSNIWFIYSMNDKNLIDPTLRDRISIIEIEGYDKKDKKIIASKYLLPNALANINLSSESITISDEALEYLIEISGDMDTLIINGKSGVRQLKQLIEEMLMKINFLRTTNFAMDLDNITTYDEYTLDISFSIKNFKLPLLITKKIILDLKIKNNTKNISYINMYS